MEALCIGRTQTRFLSSTIQAISKIYDEIVQNIDQDLYTCCIFLDLSKAFDTVDHNILLEQLYHSFGIRGNPHELLLWQMLYQVRDQLGEGFRKDHV